MIKINLLLFSALICSTQSFGLVSKCKGYYIGLNNDSVACTFDIPIDRSVKKPIYLELQKRVVCVDDATGKKHGFNPQKLTCYVFEFDSNQVEMRSIPFGRKTARIFAKRAVSGYLTIYEYYTENSARPQSGYDYFGVYSGGYGAGMYAVSTGTFQNFLMQKADGAFALIDGLNFKAAMASYFSDYPELAEKITKGVYTKKLIKNIGNDYNLNRSK